MFDVANEIYNEIASSDKTRFNDMEKFNKPLSSSSSSSDSDSDQDEKTTKNISKIHDEEIKDFLLDLFNQLNNIYCELGTKNYNTAKLVLFKALKKLNENYYYGLEADKRGIEFLAGYKKSFAELYADLKNIVDQLKEIDQKLLSAEDLHHQFTLKSLNTNVEIYRILGTNLSAYINPNKKEKLAAKIKEFEITYDKIATNITTVTEGAHVGMYNDLTSLNKKIGEGYSYFKYQGDYKALGDWYYKICDANTHLYKSLQKKLIKEKDGEKLIGLVDKEISKYLLISTVNDRDAIEPIWFAKREKFVSKYDPKKETGLYI